MARRKPRKASLSLKAVEAARPHGAEYTLWDGTLPHFGLRVHPSGRKSYIVQTRAHGRMRKITLGHFPELGLTEARRDAAAVLSRMERVLSSCSSVKLAIHHFDLTSSAGRR